MSDPLTVSDAARQLSEEHNTTVKPRDISTLFYQRELRDDLCPIVGGRRLIPPSYLRFVAMALRRAGKLPSVEVPQ